MVDGPVFQARLSSTRDPARDRTVRDADFRCQSVKTETNSEVSFCLFLEPAEYTYSRNYVAASIKKKSELVKTIRTSSETRETQGKCMYRDSWRAFLQQFQLRMDY